MWCPLPAFTQRHTPDSRSRARKKYRHYQHASRRPHLECLEQRLAPAIPPTALDDTASTFANVPVQIDILSNDSDPDDFIDPTTIALTHAPANGSVNLTGAFPGYFQYTPNGGFTGTDTFRYTVKDQSGLTSNEATVTV